MIDKDLIRDFSKDNGTLPESAAWLFQKLVENEPKVRSLMILKNSKVVFEKAVTPFSLDDEMYVYSLSKILTSVAVGIALGEKRFSVDDKVVDFFKEKCSEKINDSFKRMTVEHLLTMSTGHNYDLIQDVLENRDCDDWVDIFLNSEILYEPGTHFQYNSLATYMLSAIIQKTTGQKMIKYLEKRLIEPLGMTNIAMDECPRGINTGGWGLRTTSENIAKLGVLISEKGIYNSKRILDKSYLEKATSKVIDNAKNGGDSADWKLGYGYQFWQCRHGCYRGDGMFGQFLLFIPKYEIVIVIFQETLNMQKTLDIIWEEFFDVLDSSRENASIFNCECILEKNDFNIKSVSISACNGILKLEFNGEKSCCFKAGLMEFVKNEGNLTMPIILDPLFNFVKGGSHYCKYEINSDGIDVFIMCEDYPHTFKIQVTNQDKLLLFNVMPDIFPTDKTVELKGEIV